MKKLFKLLFVLLVGAAMFAACSDDDMENIPEQDEVVVKPYKVGPNSVTIACTYHPNKSVEYQLRIGDSTSERYAKGQHLKVLNLSPDREYTIKATIYDADKKAIGISKTRFKTTKSSSPDDLVAVPQPIAFEEVDAESDPW